MIILKKYTALMIVILLCMTSGLYSQIENIMVSNISSTSATITWTTYGEDIDGCINYGLTTSLGSTTCDSRPDGEIHYVRIDTLLPNTAYYFEVNSGTYSDNNGGAYYIFTTSIAGSGIPYVIYGSLFEWDSVAPAYDKLVIATVQSPTDVSLPLSCLTDSNGFWNLNLGNLKSSTTSNVFNYGTGDSVFIEAEGGDDGSAEDTAVISGSSPQNTGILALRLPPIMNCIDSAYIFICQAEEVCVGVDVNNYDTVMVEPPDASWENDTLCFFADTSGIYIYTLIAENSLGTDSCLVVLEVEIGTYPQITCPASPVDTFLCGAGELCIDLEISGQDSVDAGYASWSDGQLCLFADTSGVYNIQVLANSQCGEDTCDLEFNIAIIPDPEIDCPTDTIDIALCEAATVYRQLPILYYDSVTVAGAAWTNDSLCFFADTTGIYVFSVNAYNICNVVNCEVIFSVDIIPVPQIACPGNQIDTFLCGEGQLCIGLAVSDQDSVDAGYAEWSDGQLCLFADTSGIYEIQVIASNMCGADTCDISFVIEVIPLVDIICPSSPIDTVFCMQGEICVNLPIINFDSIYAPGATWLNDQFCFYADTSGAYVYPVVAMNQCGADTCILEINVICDYICGDVNGDGIINVSDAVRIINYIFIGGDPPDPPESGDCNCDGICSVSDAVWIINFIFIGGNQPCDTNGDEIPDC